MTRSEYENRLISELDGELHRDDAQHLAAALAQSPSLRDTRARLHEIRTGLGAALSTKPDEAFVENVMHGVRQLEHRTRASLVHHRSFRLLSRSWPRTPWLRPVVLCASSSAVALAVLLVVGLQQPEGEEAKTKAHGAPFLQQSSTPVPRGGVVGGGDTNRESQDVHDASQNHGPRTPLDVRHVGIEVFVHPRSDPATRTRATNGQLVRRGDGLSFVVLNRSQRTAHLLLLAVDPAGSVRWFYPDDTFGAPFESIAIAPAPARLDLPDGITIDSPGNGLLHIVALFSSDPISSKELVAQVKEIASHAGTMHKPLERMFGQDSVIEHFDLLVKE